MTPSTVLVDNFLHFRSPEGLRVEICPHLGLMSLATILETAGYAVELFDPKILFAEGDWRVPDPQFLDCWAEALAARAPGVVGFTALGRSLPYAVGVAERLKRLRPEQIIIIGGPHATIIGRPLLESFSCFDAVVRFEAETFVCDLIDRLHRGAELDDVPNLIFRRGEQLIETECSKELPDLDAMPSPKMSYYPRHWLECAEISIEAGRGCPFSCTFCSTAQFFQRRYRLKSNARLISEMEDARREYGARLINLNHDLFGLNKKTLRQFCRDITGQNFRWKCSMRPDTLDTDLLAELVLAGCQRLYFGLESGSSRLQSVIKKRLNLTAAREIIRHVAANTIGCTVSFITGFPDEEDTDLDATLDLIGDLTAIDPRLVYPQLHILSPEPGSELVAGAHGMLLDRLGPELDGLIDLNLVRRFPDIFSVFYHFETKLPRCRIVLAAAFVTYLVPELGAPIVAFLQKELFAGSLATMFRHIAPKNPGQIHSLEQAIDLLRQGCARMAIDYKDQMPYVGDLLRFGRIASLTKAKNGETSEGAHPIAMFGHDMASLIDAVIRCKPTEAAAVATGQFWCVFHVDEGGNVLMTPFSPRSTEEVQRLVYEARENEDKWLANVDDFELYMIY